MVVGGCKEVTLTTSATQHNMAYYVRHRNKETQKHKKTYTKKYTTQVVVGGCQEVTLTCSKSAMMIVHSAVFLPLEGGCEQVTYSLVCCQANIVVVGGRGISLWKIEHQKVIFSRKENIHDM